MSEESPAGPTPAGWYPDPSGQPGSRWWDGAAWTEHTGPPAAGIMQLPRDSRPPLDAGVPVYTVFLWIVVLLPLLGIPLGYAHTPTFTVEKIGPDHLRTINPASIYTVNYFVNLSIGLVLYGLTVVLAFLDRRELIRRGMVRPFH